MCVGRRCRPPRPGGRLSARYSSTASARRPRRSWRPRSEAITMSPAPALGHRARERRIAGQAAHVVDDARAGHRARPARAGRDWYRAETRHAELAHQQLDRRARRSASSAASMLRAQIGGGGHGAHVEEGRARRAPWPPPARSSASRPARHRAGVERLGAHVERALITATSQAVADHQPRAGLLGSWRSCSAQAGAGASWKRPRD